ncbi:hypothetical protein [Couchioplanes caeruleus]|uniref:Uncharacterized protein n=1 Tax=Couchioplanes caeruleus TaxID=56438 RepID=A0A3N1GT55_9ACTN|nr:hypothetical protein [Couchioplanes caeruleus]ROP33440.1 hypothetical protein EDD30_6421 [Couchioplanes caeruleus]
MPADDVATLDPDSMTVDQVHHTMQAHLTCDTVRCPYRRTALQVLVRDGRYVLATA